MTVLGKESLEEYVRINYADTNFTKTTASQQIMVYHPTKQIYIHNVSFVVRVTFDTAAGALDLGTSISDPDEFLDAVAIGESDSAAGSAFDVPASSFITRLLPAGTPLIAENVDKAGSGAYTCFVYWSFTGN